MRSKLLWAAVLALAALSAVAQVRLGQKGDARGDMVLSGYRGMQFQYLKNGSQRIWRFAISADGATPVKGVWNSRGIQMLAQKISGDALLQPDGSYSLITARASGEPRLFITSRDNLRKVIATAEVRAAELVYQAGKPDIATLTGNVNVFRSTPGDGRTVRLIGRNAVLRIDPDPKVENRLLGATIEGPVRVIVRNVDPKDPNNPTVFEARGDRASYERKGEGAVLTLAGRVSADGSGANDFIGELRNARSIRITIDKDQEVQDVDVEGDPTATAGRGGR